MVKYQRYKKSWNNYSKPRIFSLPLSPSFFGLLVIFHQRNLIIKGKKYSAKEERDSLVFKYLSSFPLFLFPFLLRLIFVNVCETFYVCVVESRCSSHKSPKGFHELRKNHHISVYTYEYVEKDEIRL